MRFIGDASDFTWQLTLIASLVAFVSGYATIDFILKWLAAHTFTIFAAYRIVLGGFIIISIVFLNLDPRA
jgi:undecaprenyl-diphosphatase